MVQEPSIYTTHTHTHTHTVQHPSDAYMTSRDDVSERGSQTFTGAAVRYELVAVRTLTDETSDGVDAVTSTTQHRVT